MHRAVRIFESEGTGMKGYKHLTEFDRNKIARMRKEGATMREIGAALHVSAATVCREIKRGTYTYMNADYIEVTDGLEEGETIAVVPGAGGSTEGNMDMGMPMEGGGPPAGGGEAVVIG